MQLSEQQINLLRELLECVEYDPASPTQKKAHKALEALDGLRAQADARPFGWWYSDKTGEHFSKRGPDSYAPGDLSEYEVKVTPLYTHPEASAPGLSEEALDTSLLWYLNHELGRALSEAKSPKLSRLHVTTLMELVNRALTRASAATVAEPSDTLPERDQSKPAEQQGLFRKFIVQRVDGSDAPGGKHHGCEYFVLDMTHDPHAAAALRAYAEACAVTHPQLSADLRARHGAAQQQAEPSIPSGWRGRLQEMRDASYTYSQYPELAQAVFDSVIDALEELKTSQQAELSDKAVVPTQPTQKMIKAAADAWLDCGSKLILNKAAAALKAGIAAATKTGETK